MAHLLPPESLRTLLYLALTIYEAVTINQAQKRELIADQLKATPEKSNRDIASTLGVDHKTVISVRESLERTWEIPKLKKTVGKDGKARRKPKRKHIPTQHIPEEADDTFTLETAKAIRAERSAKKRAARTTNLIELSNNNAPLPQDRLYPIIYADPPWKYNDKRDDGGLDAYSGATHHYPIMTIDELCELPVESIVQDDAVLFLWITSPLLFDAKLLIDAWGFTDKASFVWDKVAHNVGREI